MSLSRARQQQGHVAHQHVRSNRRIDERDSVRFEEAQTPAHGKNTYLREVTPDGPLLPDAAERLQRRRAKRVADARAAAARGPSVGSVECQAAAEEAIEEAAIASRVETEKAALLQKGVSEPDAVLIIREHHAVELRFELLNYTQDSAIMYMWRRKKERQLEPSVVTSLISGDKSECAKRRSELIGTLRHIRDNWEPDDPERPDEQFWWSEHEDWKRNFVIGGPCRSWSGSQLYEYTIALVNEIKREILGDVGLIPGKFQKEIQRDGFNRRLVEQSVGAESVHGGFHLSVNNHRCPVSHFTLARVAETRNFLLSPTASSGNLARCLQTLDADKSPFLRSFVFDTERPSSLRFSTSDDSTNEPALVGVLAAARLVLRLQRFRADDSAVLDFDGSFSAETIERTKFRLFIKARRRLAYIEDEERRRRNPLRFRASAFESEFGLPQGCTRRLDNIVAGLVKHNRRNRRLRSGGKPLADSYRPARIANSLVDSGNVNLITAFCWPCIMDIEEYLKNEVSAGCMTAIPGRNNPDHNLWRSVRVVWLVLADLLLSAEAEIERRSPRPLFLHV